MSYNKLFFNKVDFRRLEDGIGIRLVCPVCKRGKLIKRNIGTVFPSTFDFNRKVSFTVPNHNDKEGNPCKASGKLWELFVAVHRDADGLQICIQRSDTEGKDGIAENWWVRSEIT